MTFRADQPHNALPDLPPSADIETKAVLRLCIAARASLAELKATARLLPNPSILINSIPLLEARASSEIENIVTTADKLFRFADVDEAGADPATKEALRYRTALNAAFETLQQKPLTTATAVQICRTIKAADIDVRTTPGTTLVNHATGNVIYTPPMGAGLLRDKLANWERYIHDTKDVDPLIRLAVMHYQFEAIHPFTDGNGRTGRVLNLLFLVEKELLDLPVLYLSRYIIANKQDYYRLLLNVTVDGAWEEWILYMLQAVHETADWTTRKVRDIRSLLDATAEIIQTKAPKIYTRELAEIVFVQPYCRIQNLVESGIAKRQSASTYLKTLCEIGVLDERRAGREKLFINPPLLRLLTGREADV